jgi:hypothetical protein
MERYHGLVVYSDKIIELIVEEIEKFSALFEFTKNPQDFS